MRRVVTAALAATLVAVLLPLPVSAAAPDVASRSHTVPVDGSLTVTLLASDDTGGNPAFEVVTGPDHGTLGTIDEITCSPVVGASPPARECWSTVTYTPDAAYAGPDAFSYRATDPAPGGIATVAIEVSATTNAPVGAPNPGIAVIEDHAMTIYGTPLATDADGDSLTFRVGSQPAHATVEVLPSGGLTVDPEPDYATLQDDPDPFSYYVSDGVTEVGPIPAAFYVFWMDDAPSFALAGADVPVAEDAGPQTIENWVTDVRSGPANEEAFEQVRFIVTTDNDDLFSVLPAVATVTDPGPGATADLTFTTAPDASGAATVSIHADDRPNNAPLDPPHDYTSDTLTFTITVGAVNDAPTVTIDTDPALELLEDWVGAVPPGTIALGDVDATIAAPPPVLEREVEATLTASGGTMSLSTATGGVTLVEGDGVGDAVIGLRGELWDLNTVIATLTFIPATDFFGAAEIDVSLDDLGMYGTGGPKSASGTLPITIHNANDAPSFTAGAGVQATAGTGPVTVAGWATAISPGPNEPEGVSFTVTPTDPSLFAAGPAIDADGDLTFTPGTASGSTLVDVTLTDAHPLDPLASATQQFQVTLTDGPAANPQAVVVAEDSAAKEITLTGSDPEDDPLGFTVVDPPQHGTLSGTAPDLAYTPAADYFGSDAFTFQVDDGDTTSPEATVSITVTPVNDPVDARSDAVAIRATTTTSLDVFKANGGSADSAGPGESATDLVIVGVSTPAKGTATITNGGKSIAYDPTGCATGSDVFTYTVSDGTFTDSASVVVTINRPGQGGNSTSPLTDQPTYTFITNTTMGTTVPVKLSWCGVTTSTTSVRSFGVKQSTNAGLTYPTTLYSATTAKSTTRNLSTSTNYRWRVRTVDSAGRTGSYRESLPTRVTRYQDSNSAISYTGTWGPSTAGTPSAGSQRYTTQAGASASITVTNRGRFAIVGTQSSTRGSFRVYVDSLLVATVSAKTSSSTVSYRRVLYHRPLTSGTGISHVIRIEAVGNGRIDLDAILTLGAP